MVRMGSRISKSRRCSRPRSAANKHIDSARICLPTPMGYIVQLMKAVRCILAAVLLLVFGGGIAMFPSQSDGTVLPAMEVMAGEAMPDGCDRCDSGDLAMTTGSCTVLGTCLQAVLAPAELALAGDTGACCFDAAETISGLLSPPDPSPPKA